MLGTPNFQLAGRHISGSTFTGYDLVWTSTAFNMNIPYDLYISGNRVVPDNHDDQKYDGHTVRYISLHISWRLPTGGSGGEYEALYNKYPSYSAMVGTPNYVMSGYVNGVSRYHTIYADYWASGVTSGNVLGSYDMGFRNSVVYPASGATRDYGFSVRCEINRTDTTQRDKFISSPYNFPYSGDYYYEGGVYRQGSNGGWWSRSSYTTAGQAYGFGLATNGAVAPQLYDYVGYGFAVRCVAE